MGIFRRLRFASLEDTPKKLTKGEKRVAPSPPENQLHKKGKGGISPTYAAATRSQTLKKDGEWHLVEMQKKKKKEKKKKEVSVPSAQEPKIKGKLPRRSRAARSGDAIRVSAKDGDSYADILKAMKRRYAPKMQERGGPMCYSLVSNTNGPKTLLGTRINQGGLGSLSAAVI